MTQDAGKTSCGLPPLMPAPAIFKTSPHTSPRTLRTKPNAQKVPKPKALTLPAAYVGPTILNSETQSRRGIDFLCSAKLI